MIEKSVAGWKEIEFEVMNMRTLKSMPRDKRQKIADETLDIYAPLATILGLFDIKRELYNLALTHKFPRQCKPIRAHIRELLKNPDALDIVNRIRAALAEKGLKAYVELRTRELFRCIPVLEYTLIISHDFKKACMRSAIMEPAEV